MAMNKYGRATKMTTIPDKVKKNKDGTTTTTSGNTSVTMSDWIQPEKTPTPKNKISEEDYNASEAKRREIMDRNAAQYKPYNDAMAAYQEEQDKYKSSMDQYKRASDYYNMGPELPKEQAGDVKLSKGGKNRKGQQVTYEQAERSSAAKSNADLKKAMKENPNIVDINDKSINPASRKIWMEQVGMDISGSDLYGKQTSKRYVDKNEINKIKSLVDVHGENFDMREWRKAQESKDPKAFDRYLDEKGYRGRNFATKEGMGSWNEYVIPTAPKKPTSQMPVKPVVKEEVVPPRIKPSDVAVSKLPTRKVLGIKKDLAKVEYAEEIKGIKEGTWEEPTGGKFKRKGEIVKSREGGQDQKPSIFSKRIKTESSKGGYGILRSSGNSESKGLRKREEKLAKAFYSPTSDLNHGGYYANLEGTEGEKNFSKAIRSDIKDIRQEKREWKSQTNLKGADKRAGAKDFRKDIQTGRLSARYAKRGDLNMLGGEEWEEGSKSRLKIYTADKNKKGQAGAMAGYVKSAEKNIEAARLYQQNERAFNQNAFAAQNINKQPNKIESFVKTAEDNATNRNSVKAKMEQYKGWGKYIQ